MFRLADEPDRVSRPPRPSGPSVRPYVDHDFPLDGAGLVRQRAEVLLKPDFQRSLDHAQLKASERSPMALEIQRRRNLRKQQRMQASKL